MHLGRSDAIERLFHHGALYRDAAVTGTWFVSWYGLVRRPHGGSRTAVQVVGLSRTVDGRLVGLVRDLPPELDGAPQAARVEDALAGGPDSPVVAGEIRDPFVASAARADVHEGLRLAVALAACDGDSAAAAEWAADATRLIADSDGHEPVGEAAVRQVLSAAAQVAGFLATLDATALARMGTLSRRTRDGQAGLAGRNWGDIDATLVPGAPLAAALDARPDVPGSVLEAWDAEGRGMLDGLDGVLARRWATSGVLPLWLARSVPGAAAAHARMDADTRETLDDVLPRAPDPGVAIASLLARFPPEWAPRDDAAWDAFCAGAAVVRRMLDTVADGFPVTGLMDAGDGWPTFRARLAVAVSGSWPPGADLSVAVAVQGLADMARAYASQVVCPACGLAGVVGTGPSMVDMARRLLFSGRGLPRMLAMSRAWHLRQDDIDRAVAALGPDAPDEGWAAAFPDRVEGMLSLVVLRDPAALVREGGRGADPDGMAGLAHCVGGYAGHCRSGVSRIASIRSTVPGGRRPPPVDRRAGDRRGRHAPDQAAPGPPQLGAGLRGQEVPERVRVPAPGRAADVRPLPAQAGRGPCADLRTRPRLRPGPAGRVGNGQGSLGLPCPGQVGAPVLRRPRRDGRVRAGRRRMVAGPRRPPRPCRAGRIRTRLGGPAATKRCPGCLTPRLGPVIQRWPP